MNKNLLKILSAVSLFFVVGCQPSVSTSNTISSSTKVSSTNNSTVSTSSSTSSSSVVSSSTNTSSESSSTSSESEYPVVEDEEKYVADAEKRVNVTINVTYPESSNDIYIIGDFNNWGKHNTLNDSSYKVVD